MAVAAVAAVVVGVARHELLLNREVSALPARNHWPSMPPVVEKPSSSRIRPGSSQHVVH